ncbi:unnamed protein product [Bursaphelenchus xylophilus]|nr:unnamed protein product [Bursaphelenchus xylophilus]CAG9128207.1 unnamed protein product [Bursaphelenchus xylophilus]
MPLTVAEAFQLPLKRLADKESKTGHTTQLKSKYVANLAIGTPPQLVQAAFNTGSASIWVPARSCAKKSTNGACSSEGNFFDPTHSNTFKNTTRFFETGYDESNARGYVIKDKLSILTSSRGPKLSFRNPVFIGAATTPAESNEAVFGLPSQQFSHPYEHSYSTILHQQMNNTNVNASYFTLYTAGCGYEGCGNRAVLTFGGQDHKHCQEQINFTPLIPTSPIWEFQADGVGVRGLFAPKKITTSVDSGSGYVGVPRYMLSVFVRRWNATKLEGEDAYGIPCNTDLDVVLGIENVLYKISSDNLLRPLPEAGQRKFGANMCQIAMRASEMLDVITLGEPFLRTYCVVHDIGGRRVGFAHKIGEEEPDEEEFDLSTTRRHFTRNRHPDRAKTRTQTPGDRRKKKEEKKNGRKHRKDGNKDRKSEESSESLEEYYRKKFEREQRRRGYPIPVPPFVFPYPPVFKNSTAV